MRPTAEPSGQILASMVQATLESEGRGASGLADAVGEGATRAVFTP